VHCFFLFKFQAYGVEHFTWLAFGALCLWLWIRLGRSQQHERDQQRIGLIFSLLPALLWIAVALQLALFERPVDLNLVLPFHVCYILNLLMPVMLWRRSYFLFEVSYFIILAGCIQALLTPDLQTVFPEKINIRYFVVHMGLVFCTLCWCIVSVPLGAVCSNLCCGEISTLYLSWALMPCWVPILCFCDISHQVQVYWICLANGLGIF
jgi:hypothetical integral membrane protein (TIGR02206 family)